MQQADGRAAAEENPAQKKGRDPRIERRKNAPEREIAAKEAEPAAFDSGMEAVAGDYVELERLGTEIGEMYIRRDKM